MESEFRKDVKLYSEILPEKTPPRMSSAMTIGFWFGFS